MKTIRTVMVGKLMLRLVEDKGVFTGLVFASDNKEKARITGDDAEEVWQRLQSEAGRADPKYVGYPGARKRFLEFFPNGFHSAGYEGEERKYKVDAKTKLDLTAPLHDAESGSGFGEAVLSVFRATNLLSPFEKTRLQDVLRGPHADPFIQAAASFALGETKSALGKMEKALKPHDSAKWTVITYLPFLWRPEAHMFLKPEVTKDFAARVGHPFASTYEAGLSIDVYDSLLNLVTETERELADLEPRDRIDVQSFIWTVGEYQTGTDAPKP